MKKIALFLLFAFYSCGISYDGETRLISEINLTDSDGHAISGKPVSVRVSSNSVSDVISDGFTNANGKLILIFPAPNDDEATIGIDIFSDGNPYQGKHFTNLLKTDFENYKFKKDVTLFRQDQIVMLQITPQQVTPNSQLQSISVADFSADEYIDYHPFAGDIRTNFTVAKNQTITVLYTLVEYSTGTPVTTEHSQEVAIGNDNMNFTLNY